MFMQLVPKQSVDARGRAWYPSTLQPVRYVGDSHRGRRMVDVRQQSDLWEQIFSAAPCGLLLLDGHATIRCVNGSAAHLLKLDPAIAVGRSLTDVVPAWKDTPLYASLPSLLSAQSTFESIEFDVPGPEQTLLRVAAAHVPNGSDQTRGVLLSVIEATEVATLERRLQRAEYQASIGKLARGIAHELNSPLDGVLRYTHLALEHLTEDSPVREYLIHVKEGLDRMVKAVRAFLEFSRQVTTPVSRIANLHQLIDDTLLLVQHRAKFQQVRVVKQLDPALPAVMDGGLQHAIVNLIKNAFDAMPRGGTLTLTTRRNGPHVDVDIEDTGTGIPEEIRSRMFEPFFSTKPIHQGSGLGLVIAKEAVERSGGSIEFTSQTGVGTTFRMHIPASPGEAQQNGA